MAPPRRADRPSASQPSLPPNRALEEFARRIRARPALSRLDAAAVEAFDAFDTAGLDALLLKGPALAQTLYAPSEHRPYSDVDLLVAPRDVERARNILRSLGYSSLPEQLGIDEIGRSVGAETWDRPASGTDARVMIDLHRRLAGAEAPEESTWQALRPHRTSIALEGPTPSHPRRHSARSPRGTARRAARRGVRPADGGSRQSD